MTGASDRSARAHRRGHGIRRAGSSVLGQSPDRRGWRRARTGSRADAAVQVIGRGGDLAEWLLRVDGGPGAFNAIGPARPTAMEQVLETCRVVSGSDARFVWAPGREWRVEQGVGEVGWRLPALAGVTEGDAGLSGD